MRKKVIAGNWKMNKTNAEAVEMLTELKELVKGIDNVGIIIGAPFTALSDAVKAVKGSNIAIAAENVYPKDSGAYTGEVSPSMLKAIGVEYVILGHSERREYFKECDEFINEKVKAVLAAGMLPILCIGEKLEERESGKTATPEMAQETHRQVRDVLVSMFGNETAEEMIIQYGGSMKPDNAVELLAQKDIDGGLIGGASLKASSFAEIVVAGK